MHTSYSQGTNILGEETKHTHTNPHTFLTLINSKKKKESKTQRWRSQDEDDYLTQRWRSQDVSDYLKKTLLHI